MSDTVANQFIQYGCFGLLALLMMWWMYKGLPSALSAHERVCAAMLAEFKAEAEACRKERIEVQKAAQDERDKDREIRHKSANNIHELALSINKAFPDNAQYRDRERKGGG